MVDADSPAEMHGGASAAANRPPAKRPQVLAPADLQASCSLRNHEETYCSDEIDR